MSEQAVYAEPTPKAAVGARPPPIATPRLQAGDRTPFFYGMGPAQAYRSSEDQYGRPAVLIVCGDLAPDLALPYIAAFSQQADAFARIGGDILALVSASNLAWLRVKRPSPMPDLIHCPARDPFETIGVDSGAPALLVVDRGQRIIARLDGHTPEAAAQAAAAILSGLSSEAATTLSSPAPVLITPNLVDQDLRRRLIDHFERSDHQVGAMASVDQDGRAINRVDDAKKHRRDCVLDPTSDLHGEVVGLLDRRLVPEIARAFHVQVAHIDRILIARYDDTGGYFRRHRDNGAPHVAFRQFALTLNLNTGEYEGGELCFPEFSDHRFNGPAGAGVVFSGALLHEARPVTRGRRYALLTFLHDDAAEARRQAYLAKPQAG